MNNNSTLLKSEEIGQDFLDRFLLPYKVDCRYLKAAQFYPDVSNFNTNQSDRVGSGYLCGDFSIPDSCYIQDTGHFNAVEFNICYNQLMYVMLAYLIQNKLLNLHDWDLDIYQRCQLSDCLIVNLSSTFKKPINAKNFQGQVAIDKCSKRGNLILLKTQCAFYDRKEGRSEGNVTLAILNGSSASSSETGHDTRALVNG